MKIARFEYSGGIQTILDESMAKWSEVIRLSEWIDVEFVAIPDEKLIPEKLAQIDELEAKLRDEFQEQLNALTEKRANLLSLPNKVQS